MVGKILLRKHWSFRGGQASLCRREPRYSYETSAGLSG